MSKTFRSIDRSLLEEARSRFQKSGVIPLYDVPYLVSRQASFLGMPEEKQVEHDKYALKGPGEDLYYVGSGEQSVIQLILSGGEEALQNHLLSPNQRFEFETVRRRAEESRLYDVEYKPTYMVQTPCIRIEDQDELHQIVFEKIELIKWPIDSHKEAQKQLQDMVALAFDMMTALAFHYKETRSEDHVLMIEPTGQAVRIQPIGRKYRSRKYENFSSKERDAIAGLDACDIMLNGIEVGSYYLKRFDVGGKELYYVCGTGLALPRFSVALNKER